MPLAVAADRMRSGLSPKKTWRSPSPSSPMSRSASTCTLSKKSVNCFSGAVISTGQHLLVQPGGVDVDDEQRQPAAAGVGVGARLGDHQDGLALVDPGDVVLLPVEPVDVAVLGRGQAEVVRVGPGVGLGDGEGHLQLAGGEARQPPLLLGLGAELGDDRRADGRRHHDDEEGAALRGQLLGNGGQLGDAAPAAAVLLGHVDAEEALLGHGVPQFVGALVGVGLLDVVPVTELGGDRRRPPRGAW